MSRDISLVGWEWGVYVSTLGFFDDESNYLWVGDIPFGCLMVKGYRVAVAIR